jgi:hypothetical protein
MSSPRRKIAGGSPDGPGGELWHVFGTASRIRVPSTAYSRTECSALDCIVAAQGPFRRWWQVLGSNQRRLSRRFYRPLQNTL